MAIKFPCKDCIKYLGVVRDHELSWNNHIDYITNILSKAASVLSKGRYYVNKQSSP